MWSREGASTFHIQVNYPQLKRIPRGILLVIFFSPPCYMLRYTFYISSSSVNIKRFILLYTMVSLLLRVWILLAAAVLIHTFRTYNFDSTGICRSPSSFQYKVEGEDTQYFVLRNVPGDGDW